MITAQSLETVERSIGVVLTLLGIGYPLLLLVVAGASFRLAGRALAPVEAIRQRVGEVSALDLGARVPVPASGDEIARLADTMNSMLARLQQSASSQRQFIPARRQALPVRELHLDAARVQQRRPDRRQRGSSDTAIPTGSGTQ